MRDAIIVLCAECRRACYVPARADFQSYYYCWRCTGTEWRSISRGVGARVLRELRP